MACTRPVRAAAPQATSGPAGLGYMGPGSFHAVRKLTANSPNDSSFSAHAVSRRSCKLGPVVPRNSAHGRTVAQGNGSAAKSFLFFVDAHASCHLWTLPPVRRLHTGRRAVDAGRVRAACTRSHLPSRGRDTRVSPARPTRASRVRAARAHALVIGASEWKWITRRSPNGRWLSTD